MITEWTKRWKDGRTETVAPDPHEVDLSNPTVSLIVRKLTRGISRDTGLLGDIRVPTFFAVPYDYRALDCKVYADANGKEYLALVYATSLSPTAIDRETHFIPTLPLELYYALYDFETEDFIHKDVRISDDLDGVHHERRAVINIYDRVTKPNLSWEPRVWVTYMDYSAKKVISKLSANALSTNPETVVEFSSKSYPFVSDFNSTWYEEDALPELKLNSTPGTYTTTDAQGVKTGTTVINNTLYRASYASTLTIKRAFGGHMYCSIKKGNSIEFEIDGTDFWVYTFCSDTYVQAGERYWSQYMATGGWWCGVIDVFIDGVYHNQLNCRTKSYYRTEFKGNKVPLSDGVHKVRLVHGNGIHMFLDSIKVEKPGLNSYTLNDSIIRRGVDMGDDGLYGQEAVLMVTHMDHGNGHVKRELIGAESSGEGIYWGTGYVRMHEFNAFDTRNFRWGRQGYFHENIRGLWLLTQREENGKQIIQHWLHKGKSSINSDYSGESWELVHSRQPSDTRRIRFTAGSSPTGGFVVTCTNERGTTHRGANSPAVQVGISQDLQFPGIDFDLSDEAAFPFMVFNFSLHHSSNSVGMLMVDSQGYLQIFKVNLETKTAKIETLSDYVSDVSIDHTAGSEPSSMRMTLVGPELDEMSPRHEFSVFREILPSNYFDKALREVAVVARFDQGPYFYEASIFTGILGEVSEDYNYGSSTLSLSAFDYAKWLQDFYAPYAMVYANPPLDWSENVSDYPVFFREGSVATLPVREKRVEPHGSGEEEREVTVGWDTEKSWRPENFVVDVSGGFIEQTGEGTLLSPLVGNGEHNASFEFTLPDDFGEEGSLVRLGFQLDGWTVPTGDTSGYPNRGSQIICFLHSGECRLITRDVGPGFYIVAKRFIRFTPGRTYRVFTWTSDIYMSVTITEVGDPRNTVFMKGRHPENPAHWGWGRNPEMISIYSSLGGVKWDNLYMSSRTRQSQFLKTDVSVAKELIMKAFQGIITYREKNLYEGGYFAGIIIHQGRSFYEFVDQLSLQNAFLWYFDYDGKVVWRDRRMGDPKYILTDEDIEGINMSFDPSEFKNWVEVAGGENLDVWLSFSDFGSVIRDGIRYTRLDEDSVFSREHAAKLSLTKFYEHADKMETVGVSLGEPKLFLQPGDVVILDSDILGVEKGVSGYQKYFHVNSVGLSIQGAEITMQMELSARLKSLMETQGSIYDRGGIPG